MMKKGEFRKAIKGRRVYAVVAGTEFGAPISHAAAVDLFEFTGGDIALFYQGTRDEVQIEANAMSNFGFTGLSD